MRTVAACLAILACAPAAAQEAVLPGLFDVADVAADDVLNIRAAPDAGAEIVGTLAPDARDVEVVARSGGWGQVNTGERSGWASLRYLAARPDVWRAGELPDSLSCLGTEPFWSLTAEDGSLVYAAPGDDGTRYAIEAVRQPDGLRGPRRVVVAAREERRLTLVVVPAACSDGMSDRAYGLDVTALFEGGVGQRVVAGCCSVAPR